MPGSKTFFAGSIQSISRAASPQKPSGSASERAWTSMIAAVVLDIHGVAPAAVDPLLRVMPGRVPGIHGFMLVAEQDVDGRDSPAMTRINPTKFSGAIVTRDGINSRPNRAEVAP